MIEIQQMQQPSLSSHLSGLPNSPLKPSSESLLDHYNYEKHNKSNSISEMLIAQDRLKQAEAVMAFNKQNKPPQSPAVVEEPKIMSKTIVGKGAGTSSSAQKVQK